MADEPVEILTPDLTASKDYGDRHTGLADVESTLAEVLADLVGREQVPVTSHFFYDLGANSLVMAHFCARVRKRADVPSVSMKDIYSHPTISSLAAALEDLAPAPADSPVPTTAQPSEPAPTPAPASTARYVLCGAVQSLVFLLYSGLATPVFVVGWRWIFASSDLLDMYVRTVLWTAGALVLLTALPVAAKWVLIGRWTPREFPAWGATYLRFWVVRALLHVSPMIFFVGNPLYVFYLRALGARIGKGVTILSRNVPVCADLLTIGAGTVIRKDSYFQCYRAQDGKIQTGRVTLGRDAFVGEKTVLDIDTSLGDGAQLGHTSALHSGQGVPAGQRWHGSPAQRTEVDYVTVPPMRCGSVRRAGYALTALLQPLFVAGPVAVGIVYLVANRAPSLAVALGMSKQTIASITALRDALVMSMLLFVGFTVLGLVVLVTVPRALSLLVKPDRVYRLYGFHYSVHRLISRMTNLKFYIGLLGDSSYIVPYMQGLGYHLSPVKQTGANFGSLHKHESPYQVSVGTGTMVADGLSIVNAEFSATSFRVSRATIGPDNFLGNQVVYPAGGRTGANCLLATKVMVPLDGEVREGVGLLGSPCFEIPRTVERDTRLDHLRTGEEFHRRLRAKNHYNLRTVGLYLLLWWVEVFMVSWLALTILELRGAGRWLMIGLFPILSLVLTAGYAILVERSLARFRAMTPQLVSIYQPYMWWHERFWKVPVRYLVLLNGTPFKNLAWRLRGVRIGRQVFDDGGAITEPTLTTIGDRVTLNMGSLVQTHSQEDGTFKTDRSAIGAGCTLGVGALVHYGVTMGDGAVLAADSFLMKGEEVPPNAAWGGNPASESRAPRDLQHLGLGTAGPGGQSPESSQL